ncbi:MAG: alginate export family protein [Dokdonella sp.]
MSPRIGLLAKALSVALVATGACALPTPTLAAEAEQSGVVVDLRYRYEGVDDAAFAKNADANTLRLRLGYRWVFAPGWQLYVEGAHTEGLFGEHYNSSANGKTQYPLVVDPQSSELNQAFVAWKGDSAAATLGRQRLMLDNQRFFGNSGWRQNEQTFDALALAYQFADAGPSLRYFYLDRVLRIFGHDNPNPLLREWDLNGHLFNLNQKLPLGSLTGYAYLVENRSMVNLSTSTFGARWTGAQAFADNSLGWTVEYAKQADWANNPQDQSASYWLLEPVWNWRGLSFKAGWEVLGGNGRYGFSTPYATLHAFNGWADRFGNTPVNGLDDRYLGVSGKLGKAQWVTTWHDFRADRGGDSYGHEFDASLSMPLHKQVTGLLKYADYRSDGFSSDVRKLMASVEYKF